MSYSERTGDMFEAGDIDAYAHGVNCQGVMGGIAGVFANKYPDMAEHYKGVCQNGELITGDIFPWKEDGKPAVYNLATQENGGADAQYKHIKKTVKKMLDHAEYHNINKIGIPQIGCGIGGLEWPKVSNIIKKIADKYPTEVVAFTYEPKAPSKKTIPNNWFEKN